MVDTSQHIESLERRAKRLRADIVRMVHAAKEGHIPSAFSILDIVLAVYTFLIKPKGSNIDFLNDDVFILSKGHAGAALYVTLADFGILEKSELLSYCKINSRLGGHPDRCKVPGVAMSTGSLGHGIAAAVGVAYAKKLQKKPGRVVVLVGDGEIEEGSYWESVMLAKDLDLKNLTVVCDYNQSQLKYSFTHNYQSMMKSHSWVCDEVDGHSFDDLKAMLYKTSIEDNCHFILAKTIKGFGVGRFVAKGDNAWHRRTPTDEELREILNELTI